MPVCDPRYAYYGGHPFPGEPHRTISLDAVPQYERLDATPDGKVYVGGRPFPSDTIPWPTPSVAPFRSWVDPTIKTHPCRGEGPHDYAVGSSHAVCNRCDAVVALDRA